MRTVALAALLAANAPATPAAPPHKLSAAPISDAEEIQQYIRFVK